VALSDAAAKNSNHGDVYHWLKEMLIDFRLGLGEPVVINDVADHLRVSATPVRESLIRLKCEGFLDETARRGFVTKILTVKEMEDLYNLISLILVHSIKSHRDVDVDRMALSPASIDGVNQAEIVDCIRHFDALYEQIASPFGSEIMSHLLQNASERTRYVRAIDFETPRHVAGSLRFFENLVSALRVHDISRAIAVIEGDFAEKIARIPALTKEGINRAHGSTRLNSWRRPRVDRFSPTAAK